MERCDECGFGWDDVGRADIGPRVVAGAESVAEMLTGEPDHVGRRPTPDRWSMLEYASHVRDVLLTIRDRFVIGLVEEHPGFKPMYREERVDLGLYRADTGATVAVELRAAAAMFVRVFDAIDPTQLRRQVQYGFPAPATRSLLWMGQQAVHELEHHRADVEENLRLVNIVRIDHRATAYRPR